MRQQVNLYQPIFRKQKKKFSALAMAQAAAAVVVGVALLYAYTAWQVGTQRSELRQTEQKLAEVTKRVEAVTRQFGDRGETIDDKIARLQAQVAARARVEQLLNRGTFSNTDGFSPYLIAFARQYTPEVWLTGFDIVGAAEQMTLQGRSSNPEFVPRYVQKLAAEQRLDGVEFQVFEMTRPEEGDKAVSVPYVEFKLTTTAQARER